MKFSAVSIAALAGFAAAEVTVFSTQEVTITSCEDHKCTKTTSAPVYLNSTVPTTIATKNSTVSPSTNVTVPTQSAPATGAANILAGSIAGAAVMVAAVLAL
ncbi:uncharacterized protein SAPINGB_P004245 [Magnusiomyces paraingens]|uniref:Uncharacterized protein n=1 Tax=Magnusiomyces paraingens TaxID=2606893 RepID=A0A5E8BVV5_9ASCO|nr:uncharacterized protein SAPINGB_P004245 [Saprochaete ingens]VVT54759.1 unnamed protein product [Saprochaete ingens]